MAPLDSSIPLSVKSPQLPSIADIQTRAAQVQAQQQDSQIRQQQIQQNEGVINEQKRQTAGRETLAKLIQANTKPDEKTGKLDVNHQAIASGLGQAGFPELAESWLKTSADNATRLDALSERTKKHRIDVAETIGEAAFNAKSHEDFVSSLALATLSGAIDPSDADEFEKAIESTPDGWQKVQNSLKQLSPTWKAQQKELSQPQKLGPGDRVVIPGTKEVVAEGAPKDATLQSKEMMVNGKLTAVNFNPQTGEYTLPGSKEALGGVTPQAPQRAAPVTRYASKEVLNDDGKPVMANYDALSGDYIEVSTGKPIKNPKPVPSAMEQMDSRKFQKAEPVIAAMSELSEKINTAQGLLAKMQGGATKLAAKANYDDDVAEYQALISGFTPLVARSLGHTGVLTQQDVDSVKELFPKPGDSKTLRDRKVNRLKSIIGQLEGTEGVQSKGWTDLGGGVRVREK